MNKEYRPEIDGLRAIAVIAVILYHAQITIFDFHPFKGGFIGVDIFFVISGYLITSIIMRELVTTGTFSFKYFYERRIRRILPVLLFVILVSIPFAWFFLLPSSFVDFSKSILYSLGFISNFYFWLTGKRYGAESETLKPFLHTWSLSVEEQYYIIFPIVLLIAFKYFRKYLIYILIFGIFISLLLAHWGSRSFISANFYLFPTRVWEIIVGSLLAYFEIKLNHRSINRILNLILPTIGLLLIIHSILFFNDKMFHPSFYTLSPIIGVSIIIWFSNKNEIITKILSSKLFVGIGLISYSLYIWHYPIFAFVRNKYDGALNQPLIFILLTLLLSLFSYFFLERPARNKKYRFKIIIIFLLLAVFFITIICSLIIKKSGFKDRFPEIIEKNIETKILRSETSFSQCIGIECSFNTSANKKVYAIGDSVMMSLTYDLKDKIVNKNYQFITSVQLGCLYFPGFNLVNRSTNKIDQNCNNDYFSELQKKLMKEKDAIIIIGGRLPLYLTNRSFDNGEGGIEGEWRDNYISNSEFSDLEHSFKTSISKISKNNNIFLIYPFPESGWNVPRKFFNSIPKNTSEIEDYLVLDNYITTSYQVFKERAKSSFELLDSIKGENIYKIYPHKLFCNTLIKNRCLTHDNKNIFYSDAVHPSIKGSKMINDLIIKEIVKLETLKK